MSNKPNRRLYHRVAVTSAALLHTPTNVSDGECLVKLVDIGMGGASFRGNVRLNPQSNIGLQLYLENQQNPGTYDACSQINARIVRITEDHTNGNTFYSIEFVGPVLEDHGVKKLIQLALNDKARMVPTVD